MSSDPIAPRFNLHRFTVEVQCVDDRIEGDAETVLANEIAFAVEAVDGVGTVTVTAEDPEPRRG